MTVIHSSLVWTSKQSYDEAEGVITVVLVHHLQHTVMTITPRSSQGQGGVVVVVVVVGIVLTPSEVTRDEN